MRQNLLTKGFHQELIYITHSSSDWVISAWEESFVYDNSFNQLEDVKIFQKIDKSMSKRPLASHK